MSNRFFVLTAGPGSGKSTLLDALQGAGYARSIEAGRGVIQDQVAIGGCALPWSDRRMFAELMLSWDIRSYRMAEASLGQVFFDRGVPDVVGYLKLVGLPVPAHVQKAAEIFRYNRRVFVAPPWEEIFQTDTERKQDFDEAVRTCETLKAVYTSLGYELVEVPRAPITERVRFVLNTVSPVSPA